MALEKVVDPAQINDAGINAQDAESFIDKTTGTPKRKEVDATGGVVVTNVLGAVRAAVSGTVVLVAGEAIVDLIIAQRGQSIGFMSISRAVLTGAPGFLNVEITIPGGPGLPAQFKITSSSATDTSTIKYIVHEDQA